MPRLIDISLGVHQEMLTWPGDPPISMSPTRRIAKGDGANVSEVRLGTHTGTHIDPPFHFIDGAPTVEEVPLDALVGPAVVADLTKAECQLGPAEFESAGLPEGVERLLLKTSNSSIWEQSSPPFPERYVALAEEGAAWLVERGVRLIGTDFLSIEKRGSPGHPTHRTLLGAGVVIVEGLDLRSVEPGLYDLVCLPLKLVGGDGAPARAILIER
jgi:arylformamidase